MLMLMLRAVMISSTKSQRASPDTLHYCIEIIAITAALHRAINITLEKLKIYMDMSILIYSM